MIYEKYIKRILDIILSIIAIVLLSPVYIIVALLVRINMGSPVLFSQERIGKDEKIFKLYKFRSMTNEKDDKGNLLPDNKRLTSFGILLRSTSLDELPELFLILKGDMSFIGPRPQPKFYGPYYKEEERKLFKVRGGLIPPDSLCKEVQCDWETQLNYESHYAENVSFFLDIKIIIYTFLILYKRIKFNYGNDDRPHLSDYRKDMKISDDVREAWRKKGVQI